jgi:hypothetical protein
VDEWTFSVGTNIVVSRFSARMLQQEGGSAWA